MEKAKREKKPRKPRLILHSILLALACVLLAGMIVLNSLADSFAGIIDDYMGESSSTVSDEELAATDTKAQELAHQVEAEGAVLLQNENNTLPLSDGIKKVNVFGWASTAWLGGGSGSGGINQLDTDFLAALNAYGVSYNTELTDMYRDFQDGREYVRTLFSWPEQSCRLYEPDINDQGYYTQEMLDNAQSYSDTAFVVLGRLSGESNDATQEQYKRIEKGGTIVEDPDRTYLDLSTEEEALLAYVGEHYEHVVVILNTANVMALGTIETTPGIDACLLAGYTGQSAAAAIPALLWGTETPSGKTVDTWAYEFASAASYANSAKGGVGRYTNAEGLYPADGTTCGNMDEPFTYDQVSYVDYVEGIYIGYKWYETADAEGYWDNVSNQYGAGYDGVVQYPFGFGLSYTSFDWEVTEAPQNGAELAQDGTISFKVRVTNTGAVAGKDVVQLYYTAPYFAGEIEKSAVELIAFEKTELLQPGESQEVELTFQVADMASYDCYDSNHNGFSGYELDAGDYILSLRRDAHTVETSVTCKCGAVQYSADSRTGLPVGNKFTGLDAIDGVSLDGSDSGQNIVYLTRADFSGTFPAENTDTRPMEPNVAALNLYTSKMAEAWIDGGDAPVRTGESNGLKIETDGVTTALGYQLGRDYDDPKWDELLDQLTVREMKELVTHAYSKTAALRSVGKPLTKEADGPAQIGGFVGANAGTGFPCSTTLAQTWNKELAANEGRIIGTQAFQRGYSGWYAPAMNLHRSPFNGRNYEYYSEDSYLSGVMCGSTVSGSLDAGVYCYIKHFICNDQESYVYRDSVYTWMTEQTLRETYLEPFRIAVEDYGTTGLMSSYNRIGAVWAGGSSALLTGVLRDEWDFKGAVITDYSDHAQYMNGDQMLRAGGDLWMDGFGGTLVCETESNSFQQALRRASKHVLYMYLNARARKLDYAESTGDGLPANGLLNGGLPLWRIALIGINVLAAVLALLALRSFVLDLLQLRRQKRESKE